MDQFSYIANADVSVIEALYQSYKADRNAVDVTWQQFFDGFEFSLRYANASILPQATNNGNGQTLAAPIATESTTDKELRVRNLIQAYRQRGHLKSKTNPVRPRRDRRALLDLKDFKLSEADLDTQFMAGRALRLGQKATLREIIARLEKIYLGPIGFEFTYIREPEVYDWLKQKIEQEYPNYSPSIERKKRILAKLNEAVVFENFLHTKFLGQKRFSLEGGESTIPALDAIINKAAELGVAEVVIGMAHRGRLNVLTNIIGKTYEQVFTEFEGQVPEDMMNTMGDGDVKYHLGYSSEVMTESGNKIRLQLTPNPSHLEAVNPVVEGFARALIDLHGKDNSKVLPILIHGDAAIAGQGIVYEVAQMSQLAGYHVGGTIHFVINNQVGFTTDFEDARSSIYCTDVAKMIDCPVFHVNGDNPEAVVFAVELATEFRQRFKRDVFVDMVCYRRHGHNESDEPKFTQPTLYNIISKHPNPREIYNQMLIERGFVDASLADAMDKEFRELLQARLNEVKQQPLSYTMRKFEYEWAAMRPSTAEDFLQSPDTSISEQAIQAIGKALITIPEGFKPLKQIEKLLKDRQKMFFEDKEFNWASAELMAYGSLLLEGKPVRISGQDVKRGTFSHRHAVLHDAVTSEPYTSLDYLEGKQADFQIYNSLLSEYGVLGFEFGYAMCNPNALVIWEAQFGDFANGAQVMIDQFISSTETKWGRQSGVVLLLPHGYEGQGPEHSSARPERFLQLSAEYNMIVANATTPANFFHLLRRQLAWPFRKPLVVMSPKSLLRHPRVISKMEEFTSGKFREVIPDQYAKPDNKVKKVVLCTGKLYYDLLEYQLENKRKDVALIRIEQLHPFPAMQVDELLKKYKQAKLIWAQEEPENMGYWAYLLRTYFKYDHQAELIARRPAASPATGYYKVHNAEQEQLVKRVFE
ncbi:MAG: 2-oxoglutarate dehydrogenase E1 component [Cytophagales bacterium]|nr:2-oxoglutarate dehydrogenase E1 component [Bernardetiaceae bacterium]MDW8205878.1 2-oxoglutarate dehydrogenase E1 component [Cytophagales bacterium]